MNAHARWMVVSAILSLAPVSPGQELSYVKASNTDEADEFGTTVSLSGDTAVIGSPYEDSRATGIDGDAGDDTAPDAGAAYVLVRDGTDWSHQAYLKASNTDPTDRFALSVAVSGDTIVVGAPFEDSRNTGVNADQDDENAVSAGAAYVFVRQGSTWSQQAYLKATNAEAFDMFGFAVAVDGDTIVVGAPGESSGSTGVDGEEDDNTTFFSGAAYVFVRNGTTWSQQAYLKASNTGAQDDFGLAVAVSGDTVVVGAPWESSSATGVGGDGSDDDTWRSGAAYVFARDGTSWSPHAFLKASNPDNYDYFGSAVAASGDTVVIGAWGESSPATGIDGDQGNSFEFNSGAVYVFSRSGPTWNQQAYVKPANTDAQDYFGASVALSGDTLAVGAPRVSSGGAVNWFTRTGSSWTQVGYARAGNAEPFDVYGTSVALSGDTLLAGAPGESSIATGFDGDGSDNSASEAGAAYVVPLQLADPWDDLGNGLAGTEGTPALFALGSLEPTTDVQLMLLNVENSALAYLVLGVSELNAAFKGSVLVPSPDLVVPVGATITEVFVSFPWPAGIPSGMTTWWQSWIVDAKGPVGFSASNARAGTTP